MRRRAALAAASLALLTGGFFIAGSVGSGSSQSPLASIQFVSAKVALLSWQSVSGASGYQIRKDQQVIASAGAAATSAKFSFSVGHTWDVVPITDTATTSSAAISTASTTTAATTTSAQPPGAWQWDARSATVDPNSAAKVQALQSYAISTGTYMLTGVAIQDASASTPSVNVSQQSGGPPVSPVAVPIPAGTKQGCTNDHDLTVRQGSSDWDLNLYNGSSSAFGVTGPTPTSAVNEAGPGSNNSNAAKLAYRAGLILPSDISAGIINHALHLVMPNVGSGPTVYPATPYNANYGTNNGLPLGTWLRLDPSVDVSAISDRAQRVIAAALQRYGGFIRDIGSTFNVQAADMVNEGGNAAAWSAAGVQLGGDCNGQGPYIYGLGQIPWTRLQVLLPPKP